MKKYDNGKQALPILDRIRARSEIEPSLGCWLWNGTIVKGYGRIRVGSRRDGTRSKKLCHVAAWEALYGPKPEGMELDHYVCDRPRCANPQHVRLVTPQENTWRYLSSR